MSHLEDAKVNKKTLVDAELKDAINALRKPNREVVGKAIAEAAERKASTGLSLSAKSKFCVFQRLEYTHPNTQYRSKKAGTQLSWHCSSGQGNASQ